MAGPGSGGAPGRARPKRSPERAWIIVACVLLASVGVVATAFWLAPDRQTDILVEAAKSGLQVMALAIAGGVVGAVLRDRDARRQEERRRRAGLLVFLEKLEASYSQVKTGRRTLRTLGFDAPHATPLLPEQVSGFRTQMALLNEAQLAFEMDARKVKVLADEFGTVVPRLEEELLGVSQYLRQVLYEFETDPTVLAAGSDTSALEHWPQFGRFVAYDDASKQEFEDRIANPMSRVELLILTTSRGGPDDDATGV